MSEPVTKVADTHCHLADLDDPGAAVAEAATAGVAPILAVAMGPDDGERVLELKRGHPGVVLAGAGLHPSRVPEITDEEAASELALLARRAASADFIGEIGLDYKDAVDETQRRRQREILERALEIAEHARLPVNLHTRRADSELVEIAAGFTRRTGLPALLHWFTHSRKLARRCGEAGIFISAGPSIAIDPKQAFVVRAIDPDYLLVETDSPVVYGGAAARPAWAARVAASVAAERGEDLEELRARLARNLGRYLSGDLPRSR
jgi:TatD DNase family protein